MVSRLDSLFRTTFRPAEQSDTWLGIKRDDPHHERRKHDDRRKPDSGEFGDDDASLSVQALHGFLSALLGQQGKTGAVPQDSGATHPAPEQGTVPNPAQRAAAAYQSTAQHAAPPSLTSSPPAPADAAIDGNPLGDVTLNPVEIEKIRDLLRDLEVLSGRGVASIPLLPGETFLDSLIAGVTQALAP